MTPIDLLIFTTATVTAAISSTLGMAGGLILLSVLNLFMDVSDSIPLHGFAQLCSNAGRVVTFWKAINWKITIRFSLLILPGAYLGIKAASLINKNYLEILISITMIWLVNKPRSSSQAWGKMNFFIALGFFSSFIGVIAGATGPMIVPFFMGIGLEKREMVATKAICQALVQFIKLPAFTFFSGLKIMAYLKYLVLFMIAAALGSILGKRFIEKLTESTYETIIRWSVTGLATFQLIKTAFHCLH